MNIAKGIIIDKILINKLQPLAITYEIFVKDNSNKTIS